jgi:hypothetical protein
VEKSAELLQALDTEAANLRTRMRPGANEKKAEEKGDDEEGEEENEDDGDDED